MLEQLVVATIVLAACVYAAWKLTPAMSRGRIALHLARVLGGPDAPGSRGRLAAWLHRLALTPAGGCSDCSSNTLTPAERAQSRK